MAARSKRSTTPIARGFYLEFVGLSGSGKSTIAREVLAHLVKEGLSVQARRTLWTQSKIPGPQRVSPARLFGFCLAHPVYTWRSLLVCQKMVACYPGFSPKAVKLKYRRFGSFIGEAAVLGCRSHGSSHVVISDQGPVKNILYSALGRALPERHHLVEQYFKLTFSHRPTLIVFLNLDAGTASQRLLSRPKSGQPLENLPENEVVRIQKWQQQIVERHSQLARTILTERCGVHILDVDASQDVRHIVQVIIDWVGRTESPEPLPQPSNN